MLPRAYLLDRFRTDASVLRQRAETLRGSPPQPGPDADTSARMAAACDDVIGMIDAIPVTDDALAMITTLTALIPLLEQRAAAVAGTPAVRAVYAGAATRIREVAAAETGRPTGDPVDHDDEMDEDDDA
ncbi:MAG: hypothetical protein IPP90_05780 [Gemmatimonadaceae bacterium]|nr:hypothetical protein [Gemmatimonadaceae bacterium]